jgi:hypothetical protein
VIELVLSSLPIDEVPGYVVLATFFEDVRPLKGSTSLVDWRLNGRLSEMILKGHLSGQFKESLIMPSQGRMSAKDIFLFGLGTSADVSEKRLEDGFSLLIDKLALLKSPDVVISFGDLSKDFMTWRGMLRAFMSCLARRDDSFGNFQVVCAEDPRWISEARKRNMDFGPQVNLSYA